MTEFIPMNELERALIQARTAALPLKAFFGLLLSSNLAVPSITSVNADGTGLAPVVYEREGISRVGVFTDKERAEVVKDHAGYVLVTSGYDFLRRIPKGYGLVVNPGYAVGFEMTPDGMAGMLQDLS